MSDHDDDMMFKDGRWFLISMDSAILSSATSLHDFSIEIVNVL